MSGRFAWASSLPGQLALSAAAVALLWVADRQLNLAAAGGSEAVTDYTLLILRYIGINVIMAASLNLVNGVTGQFSIGHAGFMAVGAYTSAGLTTFASGALAESSHAAQVGVFLASLVAGGLLAAATGYLVGLPSLRLRGDYLAIVTLGFGEIIRVVILNVDALGGARGMYGIPSHASVFWIWTCAVVTIVTLYRIVRSDYGRTLLAIREDEVAAEAMGVDTTARKVGAFAIAAFFAGVGGGLFAHTLAYLNPSIFTFNKSFDFVVMVILGGMGSLSGSILAAIALTLVLELLRPSTLGSYFDGAGLAGAAEWVRGHDFRISLYALMLILVMLLRPNGLFGSREIWQAGPLARLFGRRAPAEG